MKFAEKVAFVVKNSQNIKLFCSECSKKTGEIGFFFFFHLAGARSETQMENKNRKCLRWAKVKTNVFSKGEKMKK